MPSFIYGSWFLSLAWNVLMGGFRKGGSMTPMCFGSGLMGRFEQGHQGWEGPPRQGDRPRGAWSLEKQTTDDVG